MALLKTKVAGWLPLIRELANHLGAPSTPWLPQLGSQGSNRRFCKPASLQRVTPQIRIWPKEKMWEWSFMSTIPLRSAVIKVNISGTMQAPCSVYRARCINACVRMCSIISAPARLSISGLDAIPAWTRSDPSYFTYRCLDLAFIIRRLSLFRARYCGLMLRHLSETEQSSQCVQAARQEVWVHAEKQGTEMPSGPAPR